VVVQHVVGLRRLDASRHDKQAVGVRHRPGHGRQRHAIPRRVGYAVQVLVPEHFVERAAIAKQVDEEHRPGLRCDARDLQRLASDVPEAFADDSDRGAVAKRTTRSGWLRAIPLAPQGTPSNTQ
jgi:hypothetical protein